jgi:hypothetical protein
MLDLELPKRGFTKSERAWLKSLIAEIRSAKAVAGDHVFITNTKSGQVISTDECDCDLCP